MGSDQRVAAETLTQLAESEFRHALLSPRPGMLARFQVLWPLLGFSANKVLLQNVRIKDLVPFISCLLRLRSSPLVFPGSLGKLPAHRRFEVGNELEVMRIVILTGLCLEPQNRLDRFFRAANKICWCWE